MTKVKRKRGLSVALVVIVCVLIIIASVLTTGYFYFKEKYRGDAVAYSNQLIKELPESGFERTMAGLFYSDEEIAAIKNGVTVEPTTTTGEEVNQDGIEIERVNGSTYEAYMMIVHNPEDLILAVNPALDSNAAGPSLDEYISMNNGIAGINAGGFEDNGGTGNGGQAWGIVITDGKLVSGNLSDYTYVIGVNSAHELVVGNMSAQQALDWDVQYGVTFGPVFIDQFQNVFEGGRHPMLNPRTVIGQRQDGAFLLLVIDGRQPVSFGAKYEDIIEIMQDYGAMTAANLDGGNSTVMMYNNQVINSTVSINGARNLPTAWIVKAGE